MKFDCGDSYETVFKRRHEWHPYFAWWPTRVGDHDCRWLETIERKGRYYTGLGAFWLWQYRA